MSRKVRARHTFGAPLLALLALSLSGCSDPPAGPAAPDASPCDDRDRCPLGEVCTPLTWSCAEDGAPLECCENGAGWRPREPCAPGQHCDPETGWCLCGPCEVPVEGGCERVGPRCAEGWRDDGECGCEPVLGRNTAAEDLYGEEENYGCAENEIAQIGGGCTRVGAIDDCGEGTWGNIETDEDTIYVNGAYEGGDSNGSRERPFTKIQDAVDAVPEGLDEPRTIAIAAGEYRETIWTDRPVNLRGRCSSMVTLIRRAGWREVLLIRDDGSSVEGLTIDTNGGNFGIVFLEALNVTVQNVVIHSASDIGILCQDGYVRIENVTIRDIGTERTSDVGRGIEAHPTSGNLCSITVDGIDVSSTSHIGIYADDCSANIANSRVRNTGREGIKIQRYFLVLPANASGNLVTNAYFSGIAMEVSMDSDGEFGGGDFDSVTLHRNRIGFVDGQRERNAPPFGIRGGSEYGSVTISENVVAPSLIRGIATGGANVRVNHNLVLDSETHGLLIDPRIEADGIVVVNDNTIQNVQYDNDDNEQDPVGIGVRFASSSEVNRNTIRSVHGDVGGGILVTDSSGTVTIRQNHVNETRGGVDVQNHNQGLVEISANHIYHVSTGIEVDNCRTDLVSIFDNFLESSMVMRSETGLYATGIQIFHVPETAMDRNLVRMNMNSDQREPIWSNGISMWNTSGRIGSNSVMGFESSGILVAAGELDQPVGNVSVRLNHVVGCFGSGIGIERFDNGGETFLEDNIISGIGAIQNPYEAVFGDGVVVFHSSGAGDIAVRGNRIAAADRFGIFVSEADVAVEDNEIWGSHIAYGWQDGAEVTLGENHLHCNQRDDPAVDEGFSVPDPPPPPVTDFEY